MALVSLPQVRQAESVVVVLDKLRIATMKTYPILTKDGTRSLAFEIENAYISTVTIARLLANAEGVTDVRPRKMFAKSCDVHIEFKYLGQPYIVWEPYGDNSRYWIGPEDQAEGVADITKLEDVFKRYHTPLHRVILGDLLTLRFVTRFMKHETQTEK